MLLTKRTVIIVEPKNDDDISSSNNDSRTKTNQLLIHYKIVAMMVNLNLKINMSTLQMSQIMMNCVSLNKNFYYKQ